MDVDDHASELHLPDEAHDGEQMIRWRHARYCWVPCEASGALQGAELDDRALLTYLAKLADARGRIELGSDNAVRGLTLLCAVHPHERRAFREVVLRVVADRRVLHEGTRLTLPDYPAWQKSREPSRRLYATESPAFARLPAFARFYAAEMVRAADDDGRVHDGDANAYAHHHAYVATKTAHNIVKRRNKARILGGLAALVVEGFLSADGHVRNFAAAQARRAMFAASEGTAEACPSGTEAGQVRASADVDTTERRPEHDVDTTERRPEHDVDTTERRPHDVTSRNDSSHVGEKGPLPTLPYPTLPSQKQEHREAAETPSAPEVACAPSPIVAVQTKPSGQGVLFAELAVTPAAKTPKRGRGGREAESMPFPVEAALQTLQAASAGRFAAGEASSWAKSVFIRCTAHVRAFKDLGQWQVLGQWLAAGGDEFKGVLGPAWAASDALRDAMVRASAWNDAGRGDPARVNRRPVPARLTVGTAQSRVVAYESSTAVVVTVDPLRDLQQRVG